MNAVQCDYCGKFSTNPNAQRNQRVVPAEWWIVDAELGSNVSWARDPGAVRVVDGGEFCSRACVSAHFAKPSA